MIFDIAKYTNPGGREINEDSMLCKNGVWVVADGLGGHADGEKASAEAVRFLDDNCCGGYTDENIAELLEGANSAVCRLNGPGRSTVAAAFAENGVFRMANAGDSRVYYFRDGKIIAQTKDHSVCQASVDMEMMSPDDIRGSEDRSSLLKVLGNDSALNIKKRYPSIEIKSGDAFLVCSDGFWEYVLEAEMEADLLKSDSAEAWLSHMLKRHLIRAENHGDNYTVICGFIYREASDAAGGTAKIVRPSIIVVAAAVALFAAASGLIALLSSEKHDVDTMLTETYSVTETSSISEETFETDITESETEETTDETEMSSETEVSSETEITETEVVEEITEETEVTSLETEITESETDETVPDEAEVTEETETEESETEESETEETESADEETYTESETIPETITDTETPWSCITSPAYFEADNEETASKTTTAPILR